MIHLKMQNLMSIKKKKKKKQIILINLDRIKKKLDNLSLNFLLNTTPKKPEKYPPKTINHSSKKST